jgi:hypothetical protein
MERSPGAAPNTVRHELLKNFAAQGAADIAVVQRLVGYNSPA